MKWFDRIRAAWYNARKEDWLETTIEILSICSVVTYLAFSAEILILWIITREVEYLSTLEVLGTVGVSVLASGVVTALCYIAILKKALVKETEKVLGELKPSNQFLHDEHSGLAAQNARLSDDTKQLMVGHGKLMVSVDTLTRRAEKQDQQYALLSADQRSVVDAVDKLQLFARLLAELAEENRALREKVRALEEKAADQQPVYPGTTREDRRPMSEQLAEARKKAVQYNGDRKPSHREQEMDDPEPEL